MEFMTIFDDLEEERSKINQRYPVQEIAFLVLTSLMCGFGTWYAITRFGNENLSWLQKFFPYDNGIPTRHNIARIIRSIKPESLNKLLLAWATNYQIEQQKLAADELNDTTSKNISPIKKVIAIDGKEVRGLQAYTEEVLNVVSVYDAINGITMTTETGLGKGQEIEMVRQVLDTLNLKGCIVTLDALHCQASTIEQIVKQKSAALIQVKANQRNLYKSIDEQFQILWAQPYSNDNVASEYEKAHGRKETQEAYVLPIVLDKALSKKWPHVKTAIAIVRDRISEGKTGSYTTSYYVSTDKMTSEEALKIVRMHWGIENKLHWILDVTFKEDSSAVHDRIAAKNLASLRRLVLNLLKITPLIESKKEAPIPAKMTKCIFDINFRETAIFNLNKIEVVK